MYKVFTVCLRVLPYQTFLSGGAVAEIQITWSSERSTKKAA